jgi:AraC-like DNA-binding protein
MGGGGEVARFVCGFMVCEPSLSQVFLAGLPSMFKVNIRQQQSGQWLENSIRYSLADTNVSDAGAQAVLAKLSEALFIETLRRYMNLLPAGQTGWLAGARDAEVGKVLALIHRQPAAPWTIAALAREAGISRPVLAARFRQCLGEPPFAYLTRWRLQLGAQMLSSTSDSVAQIASKVGYDSEQSFNRAFKRNFGNPPARYRNETRSRENRVEPRRDDICLQAVLSR